MRRTKGYWAVACAANAIAMTAVAATSPTPGTPRFWAWEEPLGDATSDLRIIQNVTRNVRLLTVSGDDEADNAYDIIDSRGLGAGEVAIFLNNFGHQTDEARSLMCNDGDEMDTMSISCTSCDTGDCISSSDVPWYRRTPWADAGIAEYTAWIEDFVDEAVIRIGMDDLPEPTRVFIDLESPQPLAPSTASEDMPRIYAALHNDPEWDMALIPGFAQTMDDLEDDAITHSVWTSITDCEYPAGANNVDWYRWYYSLTLQAIDGAIDQSTWAPFIEEFEDCKGSNYWTSCNFDGGTGPEDLLRTRVRGNHISTGWSDYTYQGSATLQSPVLYGVHEDEMEIGESEQHAGLRRFARIIDANRYSFTTENAPNENVVPWIPLVNRPAGNDDNELDGLYDGDFMRDVLMLCRSKNIDEFIVWCQDQEHSSDWANLEENWEEMSWVAYQAWGASRTGAASLQSGTYVTGYSDAALLDLSSYNYMLITPETETRVLTIDPYDPYQSDDTPATELLIAYLTDGSHVDKADGSMRIYIDMRTLNAEARVGCYLYNFDTLQKDLIGASLTDIDDSQRWAIRFDVADSSDYIDATTGLTLLYVRTETYDEAETGNITGFDFIGVAGANDYD